MASNKNEKLYLALCQIDGGNIHFRKSAFLIRCAERKNKQIKHLKKNKTITQYELGSEFGSKRKEDLVEYGEIVPVLHSRRIQRDVDIEANAATRADVVEVRLSQFWPKRSVLIAMHREVEHPGVVIERILTRLAVVNVPVDNENPNREKTSLNYSKLSVPSFGVSRAYVDQVVND